MAKPDYDVRAILAVGALVGAMILQVYMFVVLRTATAEIPAWLSAVVMGCIGYYFGSKATNGKDPTP